jgi:hypothetical protein
MPGSVRLGLHDRSEALGVLGAQQPVVEHPGRMDNAAQGRDPTQQPAHLFDLGDVSLDHIDLGSSLRQLGQRSLLRRGADPAVG